MASPKAKQILVDFEKKFGVDPENPTPYVLLVQENGIVGTENTKTDNVMGGDIDSGGELYTTSTDVAGSIKAPLYFEQVGIFLKAIFGSPTTTAGANGFYTHVFKTNNCLPSLVAEDTLATKCDKDSSDKDIVKRFNGIKANTLTIDVSPDGDYNLDMAFIGATARDNISDATMQPLNTNNKISLTATRIKNKHTNLYIGDDLSDLTGKQPYALAKDFTLTIDRGTQAYKVLSYGALVEEAKCDCTGQLSSLFNGEVYKKAKDNVKQQAKLVFASGDYSLEFFMPETQFSYEDAPRTYGEIYPLNLKYSCSRTGNTPAKMTITLKNKQANYGDVTTPNTTNVDTTPPVTNN